MTHPKLERRDLWGETVLMVEYRGPFEVVDETDILEAIAHDRYAAANKAPLIHSITFKWHEETNELVATVITHDSPIPRPET